MPPKTQEGSNFDRLRGHLKADSLATKLVVAYSAADPAARASAINTVLTNRLDEILRSYDEPQDKAD